MPNIDGRTPCNARRSQLQGQVIIISGKPDWQRKLVADLGHKLGWQSRRTSKSPWTFCA
jgi:hypothetical protein